MDRTLNYATPVNAIHRLLVMSALSLLRVATPDGRSARPPLLPETPRSSLLPCFSSAQLSAPPHLDP